MKMKQFLLTLLGLAVVAVAALGVYYHFFYVPAPEVLPHVVVLESQVTF